MGIEPHRRMPAAKHPQAAGEGGPRRSVPEEEQVRPAEAVRRPEPCQGDGGSVYSKRKAFLDAMESLGPDPGLIPEVVPAPGGRTRLETTHILVDAYNRISVFACLPAFSSLRARLEGPARRETAEGRAA
jgi:hypothetical protein